MGVWPYLYKDGELLWSQKGVGRRLGKRAGSVDSNGYRRVMYQGKYHCEHRIIWRMFNGDIPFGYEIDHIDRDKLNNKIENLRLLTPNQNKSRRIGKGYEKRGNSYRVKVGKQSFGNYKTQQEAVEAYLKTKGGVL